MAHPKYVLVAAPLLALMLVAGCATPDETRDLPGDLPGNDTFPDDTTTPPDDTTPDDTTGNQTAGTPEYVMIDGRPYECHDTVDVDGVCDDYELDEGYTGADATTEVTSSGGSVEIGGHTYTCDDTMGTDVDVVDPADDTGRCETYRLSA